MMIPKRTLARALVMNCAAAASLGAQQPAAPRVHTEDIDTFWAAYDLAVATTDSAEQVRIIQSRYINAGSPGVRAFMEARGYTAEGWAGSIRRYPRFWASIRPSTLQVKAGAPGLEAYLERLRTLYPALRPANIYFTVGELRSAGTTLDSAVLIGVELATGGPDTDISEFPAQQHAFMARYFGSRPLQNLLPLNVHEYVHTQQRGIGASVLARAIREGSADWITELVTGQKIPLPYMAYGHENEGVLKARFTEEMFTPLISNWFYNQVSADPRHVPDLGYWMGYAISRAYYERAPDKTRAIREMIELDFDDEAAVEAFLRDSRYLPEPIDRAALLARYEGRRPYVARVLPSIQRGPIDPATTELRIEFSEPMSTSTGTGFGPGGRERFPVTGRTGWSADMRAYTYQVKLEPGRAYSLVLEGSPNGGFRDPSGYPLKEFVVEFTTSGVPPRR